MDVKETLELAPSHVCINNNIIGWLLYSANLPVKRTQWGSTQHWRKYKHRHKHNLPTPTPPHPPPTHTHTSSGSSEDVSVLDTDIPLDTRQASQATQVESVDSFSLSGVEGPRLTAALTRGGDARTVYRPLLVRVVSLTVQDSLQHWSVVGMQELSTALSWWG